MEFKYLVVLTILGVATGMSIPAEKTSVEVDQFSAGGPPNSDLASDFPTSDEGESPRDKRDIFKKWNKDKGEVYMNRQYDYGVTRYNRNDGEVHHHHHYTLPEPALPVLHVEHVAPTPVPNHNHEYHHYHGGYSSGNYPGQGATYYSGGYSNPYPPRFSEGYTHEVRREYSAPASPPQQEESSSSAAAAPSASNGNTVDRGQGAAAVNNIAIIHARAGSSSSRQSVPDSQVDLFKAFGVSGNDYISKEGGD